MTCSCCCGPCAARWPLPVLMAAALLARAEYAVRRVARPVVVVLMLTIGTVVVTAVPLNAYDVPPMVVQDNLMPESPYDELGPRTPRVPLGVRTEMPMVAPVHPADGPECFSAGSGTIVAWACTVERTA